MIIAPHFEVMTTASGDEFSRALLSFRPDVAVIDVSIPGTGGINLARRALREIPELAVVFLSTYTDSAYIDEAARMGARAYLSKAVAGQELVSTLKDVSEGKVLLKPLTCGPDGCKVLTKRQKEVLKLIASGAAAKDIANTLKISVRTAEFHRAAIMDRLKMHSTAQMTRYALSNDLM
jgi:DNA-binding NarL/FixJ family response regulator